MSNKDLNIDWDNIPSLISHEVLRAKQFIDKENYYMGILQIRDAYEVTLKTLSLSAIAIYDTKVIKLDAVHKYHWYDFYNKYKNNLKSNRKFFKDFDKIPTDNLANDNIEINPLEKYDINDIVEYLKYKNVLDLILAKQMTLGEWINILRSVSKFKHIPSPILNLSGKLLKIVDNNSKTNNGFNLVGWRNSEIGHGALKLVLDENDVLSIKKILTFLEDFIYSNKNDFYSLDFHFNNSYLNGVDPISKLEVYESPIHLTINQEGTSETFNLEPIITITQGGIYLFDSFHPWKLQSYSIDYPNGKKSSSHEKLQKWLDERRVRIGYKRDEIYQTLNDARVSSEIRDFMSNMVNVINYVKPQYLKEVLEDYIYDNDKGIAIFRMDRGMGKTVFTKALNQNDKPENLFDLHDDEIFIRTMHLNSYILNTRSLFFQNLTETLNDKQYTRDFHIKTNKDDIDDPDGYRKNVAEYLNTFKQEIQPHNKLMLVIDGLDELPGGLEESILECIPSSQMLDDDIYIVMTSRSPEGSNDLIFDEINKLKELCELDEFIYNLDNDDYKDFIKSYLLKSKLPDNLIRKLFEDTRSLRMVYLTLYSICYKYSQDSINIDHSLLVDEYIKILCNNAIGSNQVTSSRYKKLIDEVMIILTFCREPISLIELKYLMEQYTNDYELLGIINDLNPLIKISRTSDRNNTYSLSHQIIYDQASRLYSSKIDILKKTLWKRIESLNISDINTLLRSADVNIKRNSINNIVNAISGVLLLFSKFDFIKSEDFISTHNSSIMKLYLLTEFIGRMKDILKKYEFLIYRRKQLYKIINYFLSSDVNKANNRSLYYNVLYNYSLYLRATQTSKNLEESIIHFKTLLNELDNKNKDEATFYYEVLNSYGIALRRNKNNNEAVKCFEKARYYFKNLENKTNRENLSYAQIIANEAIDLRNKFYSTFDVSLIEKAIDISKKSITIKASIQDWSEKTGDGDSIAFTYHSRGIAEFLSGVYRVLYIDNKHERSTFYKNIFVLKKELQNHELNKEVKQILDRSIYDYRKSIEIFKSVNEKGYRIAEINLAHCWVHLADVLWLINKNEEAERSYVNGIKLYNTYIKNGNELSIRMKIYTLINLIDLTKNDEHKKLSYVIDLEEEIRSLAKNHSSFGLRNEYTNYLYQLFRNKPELTSIIK